MAATAAVACVVGAGLTGGNWLARRVAEPDPATTEGVVRLGPPSPLGDEIPMTGGGDSFAPSAVSGDRVLVGWRTGRLLVVRAADLETGRPAGPERALGQSDNPPDVVGLPWAFVAIAHGAGPGDRAYILSRENGEPRWSLPFDDQKDDLLYHPAALVVMSGGVTRGFDWDTGVPVWEVPAPGDPPVRSLGMFTPADPLPRDASTDADPFDYARPLADDRLLQLTAAGALAVRDARTGEQLSSRPGVAPAGKAEYVAYGGRLYAWSRATPFRLTVTDVDGDGPPRQLYRGAAGRYGSHVVPCGTGRVCFVESTGSASEVVAVEVASGREAWRTPVAVRAGNLLPVGTRVLVSSDDGTSHALLDGAGRQLLRPQEQGAPLVWLSAGTLLTMGRQDLVEVSATDGARRVLGPSPDGRWRCSSWTERRLVCRAGDAFHVWSITG